MVNKELHPFPDTCSLLRIFLAPLVCTPVLFESINHPADDVQPFRIAFVFSIFLNNVTRCKPLSSPYFSTMLPGVPPYGPFSAFKKARRWLAITLAKRVSKDQTSSYDTSAYPSWHLAFHA